MVLGVFVVLVLFVEVVVFVFDFIGNFGFRDGFDLIIVFVDLLFGFFVKEVVLEDSWRLLLLVLRLLSFFVSNGLVCFWFRFRFFGDFRVFFCFFFLWLYLGFFLELLGLKGVFLI